MLLANEKLMECLFLQGGRDAVLAFIPKTEGCQVANGQGDGLWSCDSMRTLMLTDQSILPRKEPNRLGSECHFYCSLVV